MAPAQGETLVRIRSLLTSKNGFTLLEVTIAAVIITIVMASVYSSFRTGMLASERTESMGEVFQIGRAVSEIIEADLKYIYIPGNVNLKPVLLETDDDEQYEEQERILNYFRLIGESNDVNENDLDMPQDTISFITRTRTFDYEGDWDDASLSWKYEFNRVKYYIAPDDRDDEKFYLYRAQTRWIPYEQIDDDDRENLDQEDPFYNDSDKVVEVLSDKIIGLNIRYRFFDVWAPYNSAGEWKDSWDSRTNLWTPETLPPGQDPEKDKELEYLRYADGYPYTIAVEFMVLPREDTISEDASTHSFYVLVPISEPPPEKDVDEII
jgi:prepilin-type N-terminal cleavage/methylation domain-containing protein